MFETLTESEAVQRGIGRRLASGAISLAVHSGIIFGAVVGTMPSEAADSPEVRDAPLKFVIGPPEKDVPPPRPLDRPPPRGRISLVAPVNVPFGIPPIDSSQTIDLGLLHRYDALESVFAIPDERESDAGPMTYSVSTVDEAPQRISSPPLEYPRMMQRAGIEGTVVVQAIVDSTGRVEKGSAVIVQSDNAAFDGAAKRLVEHSLFQPGRVRGRAVRVLIQIPVQFRLVGAM
jgi:TonB family protein